MKISPRGALTLSTTTPRYSSACDRGKMAASSHMLHHLLRPPPPQPSARLPPSPSSFFSLFLRLKPVLSTAPTTTTTNTATIIKTRSSLSKPLRRTIHFTHSLSPLFSHSFSTLTPSTALPDDPSASFQVQEEEEEEKEEEQEEEEEIEEFDGEVESGSEDLELGGTGVEGFRVAGEVSSSSSLPSLSVKEKKELASFAHSLGKKLKSQLVGKSGVTDNLASSFVETLEANELLKIKIHRTCPGELGDVVKQLEQATGSVVVSQIGRTVIVYRPSISKLKAEEKKMEARKAFFRKLKPRLPSEPERRFSARGRRGSSRFKHEI